MKQTAVAVFGALFSVLIPVTRLVAQHAPAPPVRRVVFVCEHGTVKSLIALEYFNRLAHARGLDLVAISRGTHPDSAVPEQVRTGLRRDGFDVRGFQPHGLAAADLVSAILVVTLDADVGPLAGQSLPIDRWNGLPSVLSNYANGRSAIAARVGMLVDSLARGRTGRR